jgi:hypothetical protein
MSLSEPLISNNCIVNDKIIDKYIQKKNKFLCERNRKAILNALFTIFTTGLYYYDIYTDLRLCVKYYQDGDIWWFGITLGIVVVSGLLNSCILFKYSYLQEFKFYLKKKQLGRLVFQSFCLLFQLEMLFW